MKSFKNNIVYTDYKDNIINNNLSKDKIINNNLSKDKIIINNLSKDNIMESVIH